MDDLRLNAVWALKVSSTTHRSTFDCRPQLTLTRFLLQNVAYRSPPDIKARILDAVPISMLLSFAAFHHILSLPRSTSDSQSFHCFYRLLSPSSPTAVQAQALVLVRNLLADSNEQEVESLVINSLTKRRLEALIEEKTGLLRAGLGPGEEEVVYQVSRRRKDEIASRVN